MSGPIHKARNAGALAIALWLLTLWASPAVSVLLASSGPSTSAHSCCRNGRAACCQRKTHSDVSGPRISSAACPNACAAIGKFLPTQVAPFVLAGVRLRTNVVSQPAEHRELSRNAASISPAALFQRPPPSC